MNETSPGQRPELPERWINEIFTRMGFLYGNRFVAQWRDQDPDGLRKFWAIKLGGFADRADILKEALETLDDRPNPPTLPEFVAICRAIGSRKGTAYLALPAPEIDRKTAAERIKELRQRYVTLNPKKEPDEKFIGNIC
jgi:hypothetical protein